MLDVIYHAKDGAILLMLYVVVCLVYMNMPRLHT